MMVVQEVSIVFFPAIVSGAFIGLYELMLIHRDESFRGSHWLGHGLHTFIPIVLGLLVSFNVPFFLDQFGASLPVWIQNEFLIRMAIAFIIALKINAVSAVVPGAAGKGMREKFIHSLVVGSLVAVAPYVWPFVEPFLPAWAGGSGSS